MVNRRKQVTRGHNIVANRWAGASNPPSTPQPTSNTETYGKLGVVRVLRDIVPPIIHNSRKSVRWSAVPAPCLSKLWLRLRGVQGSGPEGIDDLCFHTYGKFSPSPPSFSPSTPPPGPYLSLEVHIPASTPKSQSLGQNPTLRRRRKFPICVKA